MYINRSLIYDKNRIPMSCEPNEMLIIQEVLDGLSVCITWDAEKGSIIAYSDGKQITVENNPYGLWDFINTIDKKLAEEYMDNYVYFGTWLVPGVVKYSAEHYFKFYITDIYSKNSHTYSCPTSDYPKLGMMNAPVFYLGFAQGIFNLKSYLGTSALGSTEGAGITVKSLDKDNGYVAYTPTYLKTLNIEDTAQHKSDNLDCIVPKITDSHVEKVLLLLEQFNYIPSNWPEWDVLALMTHVMLPIFALAKETPTDIRAYLNELRANTYNPCVTYIEKAQEKYKTLYNACNMTNLFR